MPHSPESIAARNQIVEAIRSLRNGGCPIEVLGAYDSLLGPIIDALNDIAGSRNGPVLSGLSSLPLISTVLEAMPSLVSYVSRDLTYRYVNESYSEWFGLSSATCLGKTMNQVLGDDAVTAARPFIDRVLTGESVRFARELAYRTGGTRFVEVRYVPDHDANGQVQGFVAIVSDVTELRDARIESENREQHLRKVMDGVPALIGHWNRDLKNLAANQHYIKSFGLTPEQMRGMHISEMLGPEAYARARGAIEAVLRGESPSFINKAVRSSGEIRTMSVDYRPDFHGNDVVGFFSIATDITDQYETALRFEQMANNIDDVFWMTDPIKQKMIYISPGYEKIWGQTCESLYARPMSFIDSIHDDDRERVLTAMEQQTQGTYDEEYRIVTPDGSVRWIHDRAFPIKSADGQVSRIVGTAKDITESRKKTCDLAMSESRLREAQEVAQIGSWSFQLSDQTIEWTDEVFKIFEIDPSSGAPDFATFLAAHHPDDREALMNCVQECATRGVPYKIRVRLIFGDRTKWIEARGRPLKDSQGNVVTLFGTSQDVSSAVRLEEEKAFITASLNIGYWQFVPKTRELIWDKSMYTLYGLNPRNFSGCLDAWESALTPETRATTMTELELALTGEKDFDLTFQIRTGDGSLRWIGARGVVLRKEGGDPYHMVGINWDKTKEVELERSLNLERAKSLQSAKLASLGEMAAGIAHEINNPLAIIAGAAGLLDRSAADPVKLKSRINSIKKSVERISKIILGLKKFSRSTERRVLAETRVSDLLQEVTLLTASKASHANVRVFKAFETCRLTLHCDEVEIEQVMVNLINNAVDAVAAQEDSWVRVEAEEAADAVVVRIVDSGPGIPQSVRERMFDPFFTTKAVGKGTGLGLSITKGILDDHGASIAVLSDVPNTCFEIRFPKNSGALHAS